MLLEHLIKTR